MMECNDCLFEGRNEQTATTHIERWPDQSEVETHITRAGHINDKPEGDKMLGDPGKCPHCFCPASHWLNPSRSWPAQQGKPKHCQSTLLHIHRHTDQRRLLPVTHDVVCSQYRLQQLEEGILSSRYPTPPAAPPKDSYIHE